MLESFGSMLHNAWDWITGTIDKNREAVKRGYKSTDSTNTVDILGNRLIATLDQLDSVSKELLSKIDKNLWDSANEANKQRLIMHKLFRDTVGKDYSNQILTYAQNNNLSLDDFTQLLIDEFNKKQALEIYKNNSNYKDLEKMSGKALAALIHEGYQSEDAIAKKGFEAYRNEQKGYGNIFPEYDGRKRFRDKGLEYADPASLKVNKDALEFAKRVNAQNLVTDDEVNQVKQAMYNDTEYKSKAEEIFDQLARSVNGLYAQTIDSDKDFWNGFTGAPINDTLWDKDIDGSEFNIDSKLRLLAGYEARAKRDPEAARDWLKDELQDIAGKNTSTWGELEKLPSHFVHTVASQTAGGIVNFKNKLGYAWDWSVNNFETADANYAKKLMGKDESWEPEYEDPNNPEYGKHDLSFWNSQKYWANVGDYNTFSPNELKIIERDYQGVTEANYVDGASGASFGTQMLEGVEMGAQIMAQALMSKGIGWVGKAASWVPNRIFSTALEVGEMGAKVSKSQKALTYFNKFNSGLTEAFQVYMPLQQISGSYAYGNFQEAYDANTSSINKALDTATATQMRKSLSTRAAQDWISNRFNLLAEEATNRGYNPKEVPINNSDLWKQAEEDYIYGIEGDVDDDANPIRKDVKDLIKNSDEFKTQYDNALSAAGGAAMRDNIIETIKYAPVNVMYRSYVMPRAAQTRIIKGVKAAKEKVNPHLFQRINNASKGKGFVKNPSLGDFGKKLTENANGELQMVERVPKWYKMKPETRHALHAVIIGGGLSNYTDELASADAQHHNLIMFRQWSQEDNIGTQDFSNDYSKTPDEAGMNKFDAIGAFNDAVYSGFTIGYGGTGYVNSWLSDMSDRATRASSYDAFFVGVLGSLMPTNFNAFSGRMYSKAQKSGERRLNTDKNSQAYGLYEGENINPFTGEAEKKGLLSRINQGVGTGITKAFTFGKSDSNPSLFGATGLLSSGWQQAKLDFNSQRNLEKQKLNALNAGLDKYVRNATDINSIFSDLNEYEASEDGSLFGQDYHTSAGLRTAMYIAKMQNEVGGQSTLVNELMKKLGTFHTLSEQEKIEQVQPAVDQYIKDKKLNPEDENDALKIRIFTKDAIQQALEGSFVFRSNIVKFREKMKDLDDKFGWNLDDATKAERAYQELMLDHWRQRAAAIENIIRGTETVDTKNSSWISRLFSSSSEKKERYSGKADYRTLNEITEELNGKEEITRVKNPNTGVEEEKSTHVNGLYDQLAELQLDIQEVQKDIERDKKEYGKANDADIFWLKTWQIQMFQVKSAIKQAETRKKYLKAKEAEHKALTTETTETTKEGESKAATETKKYDPAEDIVTVAEMYEMTPADRAMMLKNRDKFKNEKQKEEIDKFISELIQKFTDHQEKPASTNSNIIIGGEGVAPEIDPLRLMKKDLSVEVKDTDSKEDIENKLINNLITYQEGLQDQIDYVSNLMKQQDYNNTLRDGIQAARNITKAYILKEYVPRIKQHIIDKGNNFNDIYAFIYLASVDQDAQAQWEDVESCLKNDRDGALSAYRGTQRLISQASDDSNRMFPRNNIDVTSEDRKQLLALLFTYHFLHADNIDSTADFKDWLSANTEEAKELINETNALINLINSKDISAADTIENITLEHLNELLDSAIQFNNSRVQETVKEETDAEEEKETSSEKEDKKEPSAFDKLYDSPDGEKKGGHSEGTPGVGETLEDEKKAAEEEKHEEEDKEHKYDAVDQHLSINKIKFRYNTNSIYFSELLQLIVDSLKNNDVPAQDIIDLIDTVVKDSSGELLYKSEEGFTSYLKEIGSKKVKSVIMDLENVLEGIKKQVKERAEKVKDDIISGKVFDFAINDKYMVMPVDGTMQSYNMVFDKQFEYGPDGNKGTGLAAEFERLGGKAALDALNNGDEFFFIYQKNEDESKSKIWLAVKKDTDTAFDLGEEGKYLVIGVLSNRVLNESDASTTSAEMFEASKKYHEQYQSVRDLVDDSNENEFQIIKKDGDALTAKVKKKYSAVSFGLKHNDEVINRDVTKIFEEEGVSPEVWLHAVDNDLLNQDSNRGLRWVKADPSISVKDHIEYNGRGLISKTLSALRNKKNVTLKEHHDSNQPIEDFNESTKLTANSISNYLFGNVGYNGVVDAINNIYVEEDNGVWVPQGDTNKDALHAIEKTFRNHKFGSGLFMANGFNFQFSIVQPASKGMPPSIQIFLTYNNTDLSIPLTSNSITLGEKINTADRKAIVEEILTNIIFDKNGEIRTVPNSTNEAVKWLINWNNITSTGEAKKDLAAKRAEMLRIWNDNLLETNAAFLHPQLAGFTFDDPINPPSTSGNDGGVVAPDGIHEEGYTPRTGEEGPALVAPEETVVKSNLQKFSNKVMAIRKAVREGAKKMYAHVTTIAGIDNEYGENTRREMHLGFGNTIDVFIRNIQNGIINKDNIREKSQFIPNASRGEYEDLFLAYNKIMEDLMEGRIEGMDKIPGGLIPVYLDSGDSIKIMPKIKVIGSDGKKGTLQLTGEIDLLFRDKDNNYYLVDIKTKYLSPTLTEEERQKNIESSKEYWTCQDSVYSNALSSLNFEEGGQGLPIKGAFNIVVPYYTEQKGDCTRKTTNDSTEEKVMYKDKSGYEQVLIGDENANMVIGTPIVVTGLYQKSGNKISEITYGQLEKHDKKVTGTEDTLCDKVVWEGEAPDAEDTSFKDLLDNGSEDLSKEDAQILKDKATKDELSEIKDLYKTLNAKQKELERLQNLSEEDLNNEGGQALLDKSLQELNNAKQAFIVKSAEVLSKYKELASKTVKIQTSVAGIGKITMEFTSEDIDKCTKALDELYKDPTVEPLALTTALGKIIGEIIYNNCKSLYPDISTINAFKIKMAGINKILHDYQEKNNKTLTGQANNAPAYASKNTEAEAQNTESEKELIINCMPMI